MRGETISVRCPACPCCGEVGTVGVPKDGYQKWQGGVDMSTAMPGTLDSVREMLETGTHPGCAKDS